MKVILLADVKPLGKRGDVADVADGYANNFLLRASSSTEATPKGAIKQLEQQKQAPSQTRQAEERSANAQDVGHPARSSKPVHVTAKAGGNGKLFGAITNAQIAEAIAHDFEVDLDRHKIELKDGIKADGTYPIEVRLGNNVVAKSNIRVVAAK